MAKKPKEAKMPATAMAILMVDIMGLAASDLGGILDSDYEDQHADTHAQADSTHVSRQTSIRRPVSHFMVAHERTHKHILTYIDKES